MNLPVRKFSLTNLLLSTAALSLAPLSAQSLSVNFGANETNGTINNSSALTAGALPVPGTGWTNAIGLSGSATNLINNSGTATSAGVSWTSANTWRSGSSGATASSLNGNLLKGYLDDSPAVVTVSNIPYLLFDLYTINASGQNGAVENTNYNAHPVQVNGTWYSYNGSDTVAADAIWTAKGWTDDDTLTEGSHYLKIENVASPGLSITSRNNSAGNRGSIAGIQVQNTYTGTLSFWDVDGATAGAGGVAPVGTWDGATSNWSASQDGNVASGTWTSGNGAVFSAGTNATDPYTVTISGTQTASALWFQEGTTTLTGGGITLNGQAIIRADSPSTGIINSPIGGTNGVFKVGSGAISLGAQSTFTGNTIVNEGTLRLTGGGGVSGTIRGSVDVNQGAVLELATGDATGYGVTGTQLTEINLNGGNLNVAVTSNQTLGNGVINMRGATITGIANSNLDFFQGSSAINSLASNTTSTISGTSLSIRQNGGLTINVENGGAANDLDIASLIQSKAPAGQPLTKTGDGTLRFSGTGKTYNTATNVEEGKLLVNTTLLNTSSVNISPGATAEFGATNIFVSGHGGILGATRTLNVDGGNLIMANTFDARFGNVNLSNGATWTSNRALTAWDALMGETSAGAAVVTVSGTGASTMNGTGGIHLNHVATFDVADTTGDFNPDLGISMVIANGGNIGGLGGINKIGLGTLEISGSSIYTGITTVAAGELSITGSLGVTAVTVNPDAILSGTGTIGGSVHFDAAGKLDVTNGILTVTGNVSFDDFGFDDVIGFDPYSAVNGIYTLINGNDFTFDNVQNFGQGNALDLGSGRSAWFESGSLAAVVVPEPSTFGLILLSAIALIRRKRA